MSSDATTTVAGVPWNPLSWDWKRSDDGVFSAPSAQRNGAAILAVYSELVFSHCTRVLEVGSGTGEHMLSWATAWPAVEFQPTELSEEGQLSIAARTRTLANVRAPYALALESAATPDDGSYDAVVACNLLHVSPVACVRHLPKLAARVGAKRVAVYGAFKRHGSHTGFSNANFDAMLRKTNPEWGLRDVESELLPAFALEGFDLHEVRDMPANNFVVVFVRQ